MMQRLNHDSLFTLLLNETIFYLQVYARFLAKDHDSGRVSYFVSRRTWLKVTELVLTLMRVSDPRIATLRGRVLQGRSTGRTEVQVLSPITGTYVSYNFRSEVWV